MLLHNISRQACLRTGLGVTDNAYTSHVNSTFLVSCLYCGKSLETDRVAVEHLDGMNRFRLGLHIPGNVAVACVACNREKRRDDQLSTLVLADTGWKSFLSHDGSLCPAHCKSCTYWSTRFPNLSQRKAHLKAAVSKIEEFRRAYSVVLTWNQTIRGVLHHSVETLYRECQEFAVSRISSLSKSVNEHLMRLPKLDIEERL